MLTPPRPRDELSMTRSPSLSVRAALRLFATAPRDVPPLFFFSATMMMVKVGDAWVRVGGDERSSSEPQRAMKTEENRPSLCAFWLMSAKE